MVVDDEPDIRETLGLLLSEHGYAVKTASSSAESLELMAKHPAEVVILDIGLEDEDGLGVLALFKSRHPEVKVIMLTGMGFVEDLLLEAHEKGADGYVCKGMSMDELFMTLERVLQADGKKPHRNTGSPVEAAKTAA